MNAPVDMKQLLPAWQHFCSVTDIGPIRDETHYAWMTAVLDRLLTETGSNEQHAAIPLVHLVGDWIRDYETCTHPMPDATGVEVLKFLMDQHGLKQRDLPEIGSQGMVSEILAGKRRLNLRHIRALSQRFSVTPATFL